MLDKLSNITLNAAKRYTDSHGGGGGGSTNYNDLSNKPKINGTTVQGTMTLDNLGIKNNVQGDWNETDSEDESFIKNKPTLGDLASKDSASATYTPQGSVSVTDGEDATASVGSMTDAGTLPSLSIDGTKLVFSAGELPTKSDVTVVTASGQRTASFSGTQATISAS